MAPPRMGLDPGQSYEYDDEKTYEEAVAAAVEAQYEPVPAAPAPVQQAQGDIGITEYDQGPSIETYAPADTYFDTTPAEPTTGAGFTDMGPQVQAYTPGSAYFDEPPPAQQSNVITAEDWFTADNQQRLFDEGVVQHVGPIPTLGDGSGWFSEDDATREQQAQWWQAEVDRAAQAGDQEKVDALLAERDRVLSAYDQYATDVEDWKTRYQDYEGQFNANLEAALTFDPRGEGGFSRTSSGELISNLDQQGWMDQLGTPQIVNPFTNEPQSMTDWQREAAIRDALYQMDAEQAGNFPTRFAPAAPEMTFEQYVMERQRQFAGDPDAQAWFSGFGAGAYGAAPDDFRVVNLLDRILNTDISLPYGSGPRPAEAQEYRNQGVTPLSIFGGAADVVGGAVGLGARGAGAALGTAWDLLNADLPIADMSVIDALGVASDKTYGTLKQQVALEIRDLREAGQQLSTGIETGEWPSLFYTAGSEKRLAEADAMVARWEERHPILDIAGSMIIDPLNLIPGGLLGKGVNLGKLKTANVLLKDVLTAEEAAQIAERGVTMRDLWRLGRSEARIGGFITAQTGKSLPRDRLALAFTRRVVYRVEIERSFGGSVAHVIGEERANLHNLAKQLGIDERDASRLENIVTRYERQINEALALGPGDTMVGYRSVNAANVGKADSPFHEVWDATETSFKRLDREAEDLIPVSDAGFIDPEPLPPSLKQKKFAQDLFHEEGITQADLRRILNDEVTDTEAYQIIGRAKNTATVGQSRTAWIMYDEGRLTTGEFLRIYNKKTPRDQARRILAHAGTREPRQLVDRGLVKVGSNNPAWRSQADRAWDEVNWRDNSAKFLDNTLPRIETHINPTIRAKRYAQMAEIDVGRVAPPGLIIDALQRAKVAGKLAGTKWDGWLTRMLDAFIPYTKVDGTISSDTVQWLFKTMRDNIIDAVKHGDMPIDDVRLMNRLIRDVNSGSKLDEAVAAVEAAAKRQNDLRGVEKVDLDVRALKQENEALRARIEAGKRAGEDTKSLSRQMATNTGRIKKYDPEYVSPRAPRKTAAQKVAEQDEKLKAQGIERPPSSDPARAFGGRDIEIVREWAEKQLAAFEADNRIVYTAPKNVRAAADRAGITIDLPIGDDAAQAVAGELEGLRAETLRRVLGATSHSPIDDATNDILARMSDIEVSRAWDDAQRDAARSANEVWGGAQGSNFRYQRIEDLENAFGELESRMARMKQERRAIPQSMRDRVRIMENRLEEWRDRGYDSPNYLLDPRTSWLYDWGAHQVGKIGRKTIDPMADVWHRVDWDDAEFGKAFDDYMRSLYEPDSGWRKWTSNALAWGELQKGAKVAKTGDLGSMVVHQLLDTWNAAATKTSDPLQFVVDNLSVISDPTRKADELAAINPFFTNSKEGGELVKAFRYKMDDGRTTGQHLIERIQSGALDSQPSIGWFNDILHITTANGKMNKGSLDKIDAMFRQKRRLRGQSASDWHRVQQMQAIGKDAWETFKRENFNKAGKLEWGDVSVDDLSNRLFPTRQADAQDLGKMAESIGGALSELDAVRLGYDFTKVDPFMWLMQTVKGNLSPLWMTMNPGYHIRNITGNTSAQMVAAMRSDMHVSPSLRKNDLWKRVAAAEGSASHPWLTESLVGGTTADVAQEMTKNAKRFPIAAALDKTPGLKQWKKAGEVVADTTENFSKQLIYSHEWGYSYTDLWTKRLGAIDLDDAQRAQLLQQATYAELTKTLDDLGITGAKRAQIIGANKEAKAWANVKAYKTASEALRDYRMRNRLDFVLDRIIPVHYWTTRNAMFVGRSLLDRPQAAAVAMGGFNAWEEQNKDLPPSMRWGLLPIPGNLVSWIPGVNVNPDDTFYLRAGTFVNPAVFAIPKLLDPGRWDLSSTSLPDRLDSYGALGLKNMWEAMGYQVGPQWDMILDQVGARSGNKSLAGFASWLASPSDYYTRQDRRSIREDAPGKGYGAWLSSFSGYGPDGLPLLGSMGIASDTNLAALTRAVTGGKVDPAKIIEKANQIVYGTPYTRMETAQMVTAAADQWQKGEINEAQYWAITWAITNGNFEPGEQDVQDFIDLYNDPNLSSAKVEEAFKRIRPLVNGVTDAQAAGYLLSALGIGGKTDTPAAQNKRKQQNQWVEMRDWSEEQVATFLKQNSANETYTNLYYKDGRAIANAWMKENAPWLPGYWIAYDSKDEFLRQFSEERRYNVKETADAAAVALYQGREDIRTAQTPYYVRLNKAQDARDKAMAKAGDNMILRDIAQTIYSDTASQIYDEAAENGVDMTGLGRLPRHSPEWYQGLPQDRQRFLEANGAMEDVEELRTTQEQRGHILDKVAERLNVTRYVTDESGHRVLNPAYGGEDEWDEGAFQAALKEAADAAPAVYQEIASQYRDFKKMGFDSGITVGALLPVTPADFIQHTGPDDPELAAWREEKYAAWGKIQEMPKETKEERAAQYDAKQAFFNEYGEFPARGNQVKGPSGYTYGEKDGDLYDALTDAAYGEKVQTVSDWYWNQLTPRQRKELESEYPDAFTEVDRQSDDGGTYKGTDFDPKRLTGDQLSRIIYSNNIQMVGVEEQWIPGQGGSSETPEQPGDRAKNEARVQKINDLNEQYDGVLTEDDQAALDLYYGVRNDPRYQEARAYAESHKTKNGKLGWYAAKDAGYADIVEAYFSALDGASPVFDKQEAWVNGLSEEDRNLLIEEYPSRFGRYGEDSGGGTSSGSASSTTGPSASSSSPSGSGSSGKSGSRSSGSSYSRSSSSRSSGSGFWSGGSSNRSSGSGGGTGSVGQPSADDFVSVLTGLDPFLAEGNDDGRGEIVSQISTRLARQFGPILLIMPANRRTMIQSMLLRWVTMTLGNNPSLESWQKVLAELTKNDKPDQQQASTPVTLPVPLTAGY